MKKKTIIIIISVVLVAVLLFFLIRGSNSYELAFHTTTAQQDSVEVAVTATGEIQPVTQVEVGTQISGIVEKIFVDFNSEVKKGQLLAEIDKSTLIEQLRQSEASVSDAKSNLTFAQQNYDRVKQLYDNKAATQASYEDASNTLTKAKNQLVTARSNLQKAQVNLSYAEIYSPISGVVLNRAVDQGQTVAASFNTPTLFTIANDLTKMQVEADVDEADIGQVKIGQAVRFTVDAFPDDIFYGTVQQVRLQPTVISNVVTYVVIIEAPNPDEKLFPGMTANATIIVNKGSGAVVPTEAFHFKMDDDIMKKLKKEQYVINPLPSPPKPHEKTVWIQKGQALTQKVVKTGINDETKTIVDGGLQPDDTILLSISQVKKSEKEKTANPMMPQRPQRQKR